MSMRDVSPKRLNDATAEEWDQVNKPQHYRVGEVEAIDYIEQQLGSGVKDYLLGNVHKYLHRHRFKGQPVEDLRKARWYLEKLINQEVSE
jgi:acyl-homoserine lactone acylase PvdQ